MKRVPQPDGGGIEGIKKGASFTGNGLKVVR